MHRMTPVQDAIRQWRQAAAREAIAPPGPRMIEAMAVADLAAVAIASAKPQSLEDQRARLLWAWRRLGPMAEAGEPATAASATQARRVLWRVIAAMKNGRTLPNAARDLRDVAFAIEGEWPELAHTMHPAPCISSPH